MTSIPQRPTNKREGSSESAVLITGPTCKNDLASGAVVISRESESEATLTDDQPQGRGGRLLTFLGTFIGDSSSSPNGTPVELEDMAGKKKSSPQNISNNISNNMSNKSDVSLAAGDFDVCREFNCTSTDDDGDVDAPSLINETKEEDDDDNDGKKALQYFLLGKPYHPARDYNDRRQDEAALFWFTYRCDFPEIAPYGIRSDAGWGCMLRSAQMLLGQALRLHYRSRNWKPPQHFSARRRDPFLRSMLTWFADFPSLNQCYYSLHNMVAAGIKHDKLPGEWYGPAAACYVLRDLAEMHERHQLTKPNPNLTLEQRQQNRIFRVHVASQGTVYRDLVQDLMTRESKAKLVQETEKKHKVNPQAHPLDFEWEEELVETVGNVEWDTGLLLLVPARLGLDSFNQDYVKAVAHTFSFPQSVGVLGGRVRGARWFYGAISDGSKVFGLDPHTIQNAPKSRNAHVNGKLTSTLNLTDEYLRSVHTTYPEVLTLQKMDPSIAFGFYCRDQADLEHLFSLVKAWKEENPEQPEAFSVADNSPNYEVNVSSSSVSDIMTGSQFEADCIGDLDASNNSDSDDFVML